MARLEAQEATLQVALGHPAADIPAVADIQAAARAAAAQVAAALVAAAEEDKNPDSTSTTIQK